MVPISFLYEPELPNRTSKPSMWLKSASEAAMLASRPLAAGVIRN